MTITTRTNRWVYDGDGASVDFPYDNLIFTDTDLVVYLTDAATGAEVLQALHVDYDVTGEGESEGGNVTFTVAPPTGQTVVIVRDVPETQLADLEARKALPAEVVEAALDKNTVLVQQIHDALDRCLQLSPGDPSDSPGPLPPLEARKGKVAAYDPVTGGAIVSNKTLAEIEFGADEAAASAADAEASKIAAAASEANAAAAAAAAATCRDEACACATAAAASQAAAATSATNAASSEASAGLSAASAGSAAAAAAVSETNAATNAASAFTSAGNADASEAAAAASQAAAAASATNAGNSEAAASGSATAAATAEANAETAQAAAEAAAAAALAASGWNNTRLAKTADYTVLNADKKKTIACSAGQWILTFNAANTYDADFMVAVLNENTVRAIRLVVSGLTDTFLYPGQTAIYYRQDTTWRVIRDPRWKTPGATFYTAASGTSDNNDGLDAAAPLSQTTVFSRIRADVEVAATVTVQFANGTYSAISMGMNAGVFGRGTLVLKGDVVTPGNVVIAGSSAAALSISSFGGKGGEVHLRGLKLTTSGAGNLLDILDNAVVIINDKMEFGAAAWGHIGCSRGGSLLIGASYIISGGGSIHFDANNGGRINVIAGGLTITLTGTPAFGNQFARAYNLGVSVLNGLTFAGAATGQRYSAYMNGVIDTQGGGASYFPGSVAGATATGGQYA